MIRIVKTGDRRIEAFNARPAFPEEAEKAAASVLADIRAHGDAAVRRYIAKFEGWRGRGSLRVDLERIPEIPAKLRRAVADATGKKSWYLKKRSFYRFCITVLLQRTIKTPVPRSILRSIASMICSATHHILTAKNADMTMFRHI